MSIALPRTTSSETLLALAPAHRPRYVAARSRAEHNKNNKKVRAANAARANARSSSERARWSGARRVRNGWARAHVRPLHSQDDDAPLVVRANLAVKKDACVVRLPCHESVSAGLTIKIGIAPNLLARGSGVGGGVVVGQLSAPPFIIPRELFDDVAMVRPAMLMMNARAAEVRAPPTLKQRDEDT